MFDKVMSPWKNGQRNVIFSAEKVILVFPLKAPEIH